MKTTTPQQTEAQRVRDEYAHDSNGRIIEPGKFDGEPIFAPYYWNMGLDGSSDSDDGRVYGFRFKNGSEDFELWPELKAWLGRKRSLKLVEDSIGFVHCY